MIVLDGEHLTIGDVVAIARKGDQLALAASAAEKVRAGADYLTDLVAQGHPIYGLTTGFGALDGFAVGPDKVRNLQHNLLRSHAAGVGRPMEPEAVRAMMAIRVNVLGTGLTGISPETLDALIAMVNAGIVPLVPERGSVGACGDLAPLAHMALPLIGEGRARLGSGDFEAAKGVMARAGIPLPTVAGRDGIALINGTEQTTGIGCLAAYDAGRLIQVAEAVAALSLEALGAVADSFDERVALAKPHPGQIATSSRLRALTDGSKAVLPPRPERMRDALSLRCIPQVLGATRDALAHCWRTLEIEINAANDNPLFGVADGFVTSNSGNFHGQAAAEVLDYLANAVTSAAAISERRAARLVDPHHNGGLPAFLIHPDSAPGENSGFMIAQYTAASLIAEMRMRAVPAAIQTIPTCANTEDHVPMAPLAARRVAFVVSTAFDVVAIEALLAAQACDIRGLKPAPLLQPLYQAVRDVVPTMLRDRLMAEDITAVRKALRDSGVAGPDWTSH
ncbi:HAL/PAL/TAL family ammonia-lyase [Limibacillus halophilus]|uniref:Histidine ammonia-lyase n=1 Tax=Limibacillus halophilus TaxID=1579333 RepID=A0A839SVS2_9PROT|nr:histidine ammonia-lyase [Limibacillus halophilus]MBB3066139.1 histidine ammonia-lyase [Limibacillus halophilus]